MTKEKLVDYLSDKFGAEIAAGTIGRVRIENHLRTVGIQYRPYHVRVAVDEIRSAFSEVVTTLEENVVSDFPPEQDVFRDSGRTRERVFISSKPIKTLDDLYESAKVDRDEWEVKDWEANTWGVTMKIKGSNGEEPYYSTNFQVKARFTRRVFEVEISNAINKLLDNLKLIGPSCKSKPVNENNDGHLAVLSIPDMHLSKLAVNENLTIDDALADHAIACHELFEKASRAFRLDTVAITAGDDILNIDNIHGTTTSGRVHPEVNASFYSAYDAAIMLYIQAVEIAKQYVDRVVFLHSPGNHSYNADYGIMKALECFFHADETVEMIITRNGRSYFQYHQVGIGANHGHVIRSAKDAALLFALECKDMWSDIITCEIFTGHLHTKKAQRIRKPLFIDDDYDEQSGVVVRRMSSMSHIDYWHDTMGFKGCLRSAEIFIYSHKYFEGAFNHVSELS